MHRYYDAKMVMEKTEENNIVYADDIDRPLTYILREGIQVFSILTATAGLAVLSMAGWWTILFAAFIAIIVVISNTRPHPLCRSVFLSGGDIPDLRFSRLSGLHLSSRSTKLLLSSAGGI